MKGVMHITTDRKWEVRQIHGRVTMSEMKKWMEQKHGRKRWWEGNGRWWSLIPLSKVNPEQQWVMYMCVLWLLAWCLLEHQVSVCKSTCSRQCSQFQNANKSERFIFTSSKEFMFSPGLLVCLLAGLLKKLWTDFDETGGRVLYDPRKNPFNFGADLNEGWSQEFF